MSSEREDSGIHGEEEGEPAADWTEADEVQDDAVIGRAVRGSAGVLVGLAAIAALVFLVLRGCAEPVAEQAIVGAAPQQVTAAVAPPQVQFRDITEHAGIDWVHENGARGERFLPETMGAGAALFDFDDDGDLDIFLLNSTTWEGGGGARSALYENDGAGRYTDRSSESGADLSLYGTGVAVGDVDNDGFPELFVAAVGANRFLRNEPAPSGGRRFVDATDAAGVAGDRETWSSSSAFFDADNDGLLDLFVGNYVRWSAAIDRQVNYSLVGVGKAYGPPVNYEGTFPYFYRNRGDGTFEDRSAAAGVQVVNPATGAPVAKSLGVAPVDADGDGWIDLFVANDTVRNFFFHNQGDGNFVESGELFGIAYGRSGNATGAMGIDAGYFRNDADIGFAIGNFANEMSSLYVSQGDPTLYADEAIGVGLGAPSRQMLSFGMFFFDYDLDGRLDLLQTNGHLEIEINQVDPSQSYRQPAQLFWNAGPDQTRTLVEVDPSTTGDLGVEIVGRGSSYGDLDGDGDLDVLLLQTGGRPMLLRNDQDLGHHWLRVRLIGSGSGGGAGGGFGGSNRDAIGAWVEVRSAELVQRRQVMPTRSYQSQSERVVTFGLSERSAIDSLEVIWPNGNRQSVAPPTVDQLITVTEDSRPE